MPLPGDLLALLNACRADPVSDLPRLVLADWLDEHDDPARAEFLRVQCELARPSLDTERVAELKARERALIDANWRAWAGGLHEVCCDLIDTETRERYAEASLGRPRAARAAAARVAPTVARDDPFLAGLSWRFGRGLLQFTVEPERLGSHDLRRWAKGDEVGWLECVRLPLRDNGQYDMADALRVSRGFGPLLSFELTFDHVVSGHDVLAAAEQLIACATHPNWKHVRKLTVATHEDDAEVVAAAAHGNYSRLTHLRLGGPNSTALLTHLARKRLPRIVSLDFGGAVVSPETLLALAKRTPRLNVLSVYRSPIGDRHFAALLASPWGETLHTLEVMNCDLGDDAMTALVNSGLLGRLYGPQLNLSMNRVGDAGLATLAASEDLLRFGELVLRENRIGDAGAEALAASPFAANLRYLDLWKNRLTDRAAVALAASPHLGQLRDLNVRDNALTDVGRAALTARYGAVAKVGF